MFTDARVHVYCRNAGFQNNSDTRKLIQTPNSSQVVLNAYDDYMQNQLNEEIISLSTSYWDSMFDSIKFVNKYWRRIFTIGNSSSW